MLLSLSINLILLEPSAGKEIGSLYLSLLIPVGKVIPIGKVVYEYFVRGWFCDRQKIDAKKKGTNLAPPLRISERWIKKLEDKNELHQTKLRQDTLTGEELSCDSDDKTQHCQTTIPGFSKLGKTKLRLLTFHNGSNLT